MKKTFLEELRHQRSPGEWELRQVCMNGHTITAMAREQRHRQEKYCSKCGAQTITACPSCSAEIRGYFIRPGTFSGGPQVPPKYCHECGEPYPWQLSALAGLTEVLREGGVSEEDLATVASTIPDVVRDTPKTDAAAFKLKHVLAKLGKDTYGVAIKVLGDIASEAAKRTMGL